MVDYTEYLRSSEWAVRREWALAQAGHRCQLCNAPDRLQAHHRTYERLGHERPADLIVLCDDCHERHHGAMPEPPPRSIHASHGHRVERALLILLARDPGLIGQVADEVTQRDFRDLINFELFVTLVAHHQAPDEIDLEGFLSMPARARLHGLRSPGTSSQQQGGHG